MAEVCLSPVPFPVCVQAASFLTTTVYVKRVDDRRLCYYPEAVADCTMPADLSINNGFYPVVANATEGISIHGEAYVDSNYVGTNYTVGTHVKTLYVRGTVDTQIVVDSENATVGGIDASGYATVNSVIVLQSNVRLTNLRAQTILFPDGIEPGACQLVNVTTNSPVQIAPKTNGVDVDLNNAYFDNVRGNYIALLHHAGTVNSSNTDILWLPRQSSSNDVAVLSANNGSNLNVARLTGIFGQQYQIEQAAGSIVYVNKQAENLFNLLLIPSLVLLGAIVFSGLDFTTEDD
tara:strand:+ start:193 stop:1065 length:873 start_codon:yes stop_codon:yes gene_type:complete